MNEDLTFQKEPTIVTGLKDNTIVEGEPLQLHITLNGKPAIDVKWYRDQKDIIESDRCVFKQDGDSHFLIINEAALTDEAVYVVVAQNQFGKETSSAMITVQQAEKKPVFEKKLEDTKTVVGFDLILKAKFKGHPEPKVEFYHNNKILYNSEKYSVSVDNSNGECNLKICKCEMKDHGQYKCTIRNKIGQSTCFAKVVITESVLSPQFLLGLNDVQCSEGKDVTLKVEFSGKPKPVITWYKNGEALKPFGRFRTKTDNSFSSLSLTRAKLNESCVIKCVASNEGGEVETACKLDVLEEMKEPQFIYSPKNLKVYEKGTASIRATFNGKPTPDVEWYRNEELLSNSKNFEIKTDGMKTTLNIRNCRQEHAGTYKCVTSNKAGTAFCTAVLSVEEASSKPEFVAGLKDARSKEGDNVVLHAETKGNPKPTVQWFRNEKLILASDKFKFSSEENNHRLEIKSCNGAQSGNYKIVARNKIGECSSRAQVIIDQTTEKPVFVAQLKDIDLFDSETARLEMEVKGEPCPKVTWYHDSNAVQFGKRCFVERSGDKHTLVINDVCPNDQGTYECIAENEAGRASSMSFLKIKEPLFVPEFAVPPENATVNVGENATVHFVVVGNPRAEVNVMKGSGDVNENVKLMMDGVTGEGRVTFSAFSRENSGVYRIVAENSEGQTEHAFTVNCPSTDSKPMFLKPLSDLRVQAGENATLSVEFAGSVLDVDWYRDDQYIADSDKYEIIDEEYRCLLAVKNCSAADEGIYRCEIGNDENHASSEARLTLTSVKRRLSQDRTNLERRSSIQKAGPVSQPTVLEFKPEFIEALEDVKCFEGENVTLQVTVKGSPLPEITWFNGPQQVRKSARVLTRKDSNEVRSLVLRNVTASDAGEYKCVATNSLGSVFSKAVLDISKPVTAPKFVKKPPKDLKLVEGETASLEFSASGNPSPTIKCLFVNENNNAKDVSDLVAHGFPSKLVLVDCQVENAGIYRFVASNDGGEASCEVNMEVKSVEVKPKFTKSLCDLKAEIGKDLKLTVTCLGKPKQSVTWSKNGEVIESGGRITQGVADDVITMTISKFEEGDSGLYACTVKNALGSDTTKADIKSQQSNARPSFKQRLKDVTVEETSKFVLTAEIDGYPEPTVKWTRDSLNIKEGGRISYEKTGNKYTLTIENASKNDKGMYCCSAKNNIAEVKSSCIVIVSKSLKSKTGFMNARSAFENKPEADSTKAVAKSKSPAMSPPAERNQKVELQKSRKPVTDANNVFAQQKAKFESKPKNEEVTEPKLTTKVEAKVEQDIQSKFEPRAFERRDSKQSEYSQTSSRRSSTSSTTSTKASSAPVFTHTFEDSACAENTSRTLSVLVKGYPDPEVQWLHNGKLLSKSRTFDIEKGFRGDHRLKIKNFNASLAGTFTAVAVNEAGKVECAARLDVKGNNERPRFEKRLTDQTTKENSSVTFDTIVKGKPDAKVEWFKDDKLLTKSGNVSLEKEGAKQKLIIDCVGASDAGQYTCKASNFVGEASQTVKLKLTESGQEDENAISGSGKLSFVKSLVDMDIYEGKEALLEVVVDGAMPINCKWEKDGRPVRNTLSTRFEKKDNVCSLRIGKPAKFETGKYSAIVSNDEGTISSSCSIKVLPAPVKPSFLLKLRDVTIFEGKDMEVSAKINGKPEPVVKWYLNNEEVEAGGRFHIVKRPDGRQIFKMTGLTREDNGELKCEATNSGGTAVCTAKISVRGSSRSAVSTVPELKFTKPLLDVAVADGEVLELKAETTGAASVVWYKDSKQVLKSSKVQITTIENKYSLKIGKARSEDSGVYKILATNKSGEKSCSATVAVEKGAILPVIKKELDKIATNEGKTAVFRVTAEGSGLEVTWLKDNVEVKTAENIRTSQVKNEYVLEVKEAAVSDSGKYEFIAMNETGRAVTSAELVVNEADSPPKFIKKLVDAEVNEGEDAEFVVEVAGHPKPRVKFTKHGADIHLRTATEEENGVWRLKIAKASVSESGVYCCEARNRISSASCTSSMNVKRTTTPPRFSTFIDETNEVAENEELRLEVLAIGDPQPEVKWSKRSRVLKSTDNIQITTGELNSLVIHNAKMEDGGEYQCVATNKAGRCEKTFFVVVKGQFIFRFSNILHKAFA